MGDAELIHAALKGLGPEFKSLSDAIRARDSLISFEELHDKLADHELTSKCTTTTTPITVQYNQRTNSINKGHNPNYNNNTNMNKQQQQQGWTKVFKSGQSYEPSSSWQSQWLPIWPVLLQHASLAISTS